MYGTQFYVDDDVVSQETTLHFQLQFSASTVDNRDVLTIRLPQNENDGSYFVAGRAFCEVKAPLTVYLCTMKSLYEAQITFSVSNQAQGLRSLEGSISKFKNPDSAAPIENIKFELADR